jgi:mono/diheme cytochrome c family protein
MAAYGRIDLMNFSDFSDRAGRKISGLLIPLLLVLTSAGAALPQGKQALESRGEGLLTANCSRCHAVGRTGDSTLPEAPPFRTLGQRYPIDVLAEALAEGLSSGHPDMPEFRFEVDDVNAILAYLNSIQEKGERAPAAK